MPASRPASRPARRGLPPPGPAPPSRPPPEVAAPFREHPGAQTAPLLQHRGGAVEVLPHGHRAADGRGTPRSCSASRRQRGGWPSAREVDLEHGGGDAAGMRRDRRPVACEGSTCGSSAGRGTATARNSARGGRGSRRRRAGGATLVSTRRPAKKRRSASSTSSATGIGCAIPSFARWACAWDPASWRACARGSSAGASAPRDALERGRDQRHPSAPSGCLQRPLRLLTPTRQSATLGGMLEALAPHDARCTGRHS